MQRPSTIPRSEKRPGVLDHLSEAMSLLLAMPRLMLLPLLLDAYLLLGPRLTSASITVRLAEWSLGQEGESAVEVADWFARAGDWDLSRLMALLVPSVMDGLSQSATFAPYERGFATPPLALALIAGVGLLLLGTAFYTAFLVALARAGSLIRAEAASVRHLVLDRWIKFLGFTALLAGVVAIGATLLIIPTVILESGGVGAGAVIGFLSLAVLAILVVTMFVPEAIVIDGAGPIRAIQSSARVVFGSFWQAMAFFLVSIMFSPGLLAIWEEIAGDPVGLGIAIVVNAALITSLAIASLMFYQSRSAGIAPAPRAT